MKNLTLMILLFLSGCNNMLIKEDVQVIHIYRFKGEIPIYSISNSKAVLQIIHTINDASKEPAVFISNIHLQFDNNYDKVNVNGHYFNIQGDSYRSKINLEELVNKFIND